MTIKDIDLNIDASAATSTTCGGPVKSLTMDTVLEAKRSLERDRRCGWVDDKILIWYDEA